MSLCNSHLLVSPQHSWDGSGSNSKRFSGSTHGRAIQEHLCYQCSTNGLLVPSTDSIKNGSSYCDAIHRFLKSSFKACSWVFPPSLSWLQKTQKKMFGGRADMVETTLVGYDLWAKACWPMCVQFHTTDEPFWNMAWPWHTLKRSSQTAFLVAFSSIVLFYFKFIFLGTYTMVSFFFFNTEAMSMFNNV